MDKKMIAVVVVIAVVAGLPLLLKAVRSGASGPSTMAPDAEAASVALATELVSALSRGDFAAATAHFDGTMKAAMGPEKFRQVWADLGGELGAFKGQTGTKTGKKMGIDVVYVNCEFERGKVAFQVAFNNDRQISGLYVVPPAP
ncbi:MAG: DUF3887 domain-containing protein [Candidatus Hydrogenedentes bacterium]|nr:DUF3887 domain-containing protein [Candidatus Hydrogenedentota bacterium]